MSPNGVPARGKKVVAANNIYTVFLAFATFLALASAAFVAYMSYKQYGIIINIP